MYWQLIVLARAIMSHNTLPSMFSRTSCTMKRGVLMPFDSANC